METNHTVFTHSNQAPSHGRQLAETKFHLLDETRYWGGAHASLLASFHVLVCYEMQKPVPSTIAKLDLRWLRPRSQSLPSSYGVSTASFCGVKSSGIKKRLSFSLEILAVRGKPGEKQGREQGKTRLLMGIGGSQVGVLKGVGSCFHGAPLFLGFAGGQERGWAGEPVNGEKVGPSAGPGDWEEELQPHWIGSLSSTVVYV